MKKLLQITSMTLVLLLSVTGLSACSGTTESKESKTVQQSETEQPKKGSIKLTYSYWGGNDEIELWDSLIKKFEEENPQYKIEGSYTDGASYPAKLQTYFASNTAPDVMDLANDIIYDYVNQGVFEDVKPLMEKDNILTGIFSEDLIKAYTYTDKIVAVPQKSKPMIIVYNKKIFDDAGISYPQKGWTEDEFIDVAKKLTSGEGMTKTYGMYFNWATAEFLRSMYKGQPLYNVDEKQLNAVNNEAFIHTLDFVSSLVKEGISPNSTQQEGIGGGFETGRFAMCFTAPWDMQGFQDVIGDSFGWEIVELPVNAKYGQWQSVLRADGMSMSSSSKNKEDAWEFIKYMTTNLETQKAMGDFAIPALKSYVESEEYLNSYPEGTINKHDKSAFVNATNNAVGIQSVGVWGEINTVLSEAYDKILLEGLSVTDATDYIQKNGDAKLK